MARGGAVRLTKRVVDLIDPARGRHYVWDAELKGFGVQAEASGSKTFIVRYRPKGLGRAGSRRFVKLGRFGDITADQARAAARVVLGAVAAGEDPAAQQVAARSEHARRKEALTFTELSERFLKEHVEAKRKGRTAVNYRILLERHAHPALGQLKAEAVTRSDLAKLHLAMRDHPHNANRLIAVTSAMFGWAAKHDLVAGNANPARGIEKYREQGRERYLSTIELKRLGAALDLGVTIGLPAGSGAENVRAGLGDPKRVVLDHHAVAAVRLLILTGARLREVLGLRWSYVDLERGLLLLPDSKSGRKTLVLSEAASTVLATLAADRDPDPGAYVIRGGKTGQPRSDLKRPWTALVRDAKLDGVRLHDLRHTYASLGAGAGLGLPIVGRLLGHANQATTQRYAHLDADPLRRATNLIGSQITAAMNADSQSSEKASN